MAWGGVKANSSQFEMTGYKMYRLPNTTENLDLFLVLAIHLT